MLNVTFPRLSVLVGLVVTYKYVKWKLESQRASRKRLPGPSPWFLVGNLFDLPKNNAAAVYITWAKRYGSTWPSLFLALHPTPYRRHLIC